MLTQLLAAVLPLLRTPRNTPVRLTLTNSLNSAIVPLPVPVPVPVPYRVH